MLRSLCIAFSMFSRIPVPHVPWKEENRRYVFCFFPLVGAVTGGLLLGWRILCHVLGMGQLCFGAVAMFLPLLVTGGIHLDGFADVTDAAAACTSRERRLSILKDPHIGAFGAMHLCALLIVQTALLSELTGLRLTALTGCGFVLSRCLSGMTALCFPCASDGSLHSLVQPANKTVTAAVLGILLLLTAAAMVWLHPMAGGIALLASGLLLIYYHWFACRQFGGITGDTAGWFVQLCETAVMAAAALGGCL